MELVREEELDNSIQIVYLPHYPVLRESSSTSKLRVVFNASSLTSNNIFLNSHFHIGPKILNDLVCIILNWRLPRFVYMPDIEKIIRNFFVDARDCTSQRILWGSSDNNVVAYLLLTLTYGTACASYLANKIIKQLTHDEGNKFTLNKSILERNIYVDDIMFGADTKVQAKQKRQKVSQLMEAGGFHLRKWAFDDFELLEDCPSGKYERTIEFLLSEDAKFKVLSLFWDPESHSFHIKVTPPSVETPTKRIVLSLIAELFDPMGWLTPVIQVDKLLMEEVWIRKLD
ncbi:uncharacterized protein LOC117182702 [Belonocnema kinseyi]|uniref:uncharacterized protein LOC117182702 n=1 Tax=Belonocnema kinseyi TaxID=2817044 RepID=UPI00143D7ADC|nr:uncharacterized protein LOC117182702 [Belonocnema kinseyi]